MPDNIIPMNIEAGDLPEHPAVDFGRAFVRTLDDNLHGIAEVKSMTMLSQMQQDGIDAAAKALESAGWKPGPFPKPEELKEKWAAMGMYEGGIDYEPAVQPVETDGLMVTEFTHKKDEK